MTGSSLPGNGAVASGVSPFTEGRGRLPPRRRSLDWVPPLLLTVAIVSYPLDPYSLAGVGLSVYRLSALTFVGLTFLVIIWRMWIRVTSAVAALVLLLSYVVFDYLWTLPHSAWAVSKFHAYVFGMVLAICIAQYRNVVRGILRGLQLAMWATVPFVLYSLFMFLGRGRIVRDLPPLPGFTVTSGGWLSEGHNFEGIVRLSAPFPAPQFLGLLAVIAAFITLWQIVHDPAGPRERVFRYVTLASASFVALGSLSRSALLPGVLWCGALLLGRMRRRRTLLRVLLPGVTVIGVLVFVGRESGLGNVGDLAVDRAESGSVSRHLQTRLTALSIWAESPQNTMVGIGFGEYGQNPETEGPHSHSPYTTLLAETGLVGVSLLLAVLATSFQAVVRSTIPDHRLLGWLVAMIAFAMLLYEFLALQFLWVLLGAAASASVTHRGRPAASAA